MEPFNASINIPILTGLILVTFTLFVIVIMMGVDIYKKTP